MEENGIKVRKSTLYVVGVLIAVIVIGLFVFGGGGTTGNVVAGNSELSGKLVGLDPNRQMAGSSCHVMGGRAMGDCDTREIEFRAWRWDWSEPTITVKSGELVRIKATSNDVSHGLSIPQIQFNLRIDPGRTSIGEFIAPSPGKYRYGCSVMCGSGHGSHVGMLVVI